MDLPYSSSGNGGNSRSYSQQQAASSGYRFSQNGQMTNGPSLFGGTNLNTVFGSGVPAFTTGNQFNFPLRSNRSNTSGNMNFYRNNIQLASPSRNPPSKDNYGVYSSKPKAGKDHMRITQNQHYTNTNNSDVYIPVYKVNTKQKTSKSHQNSIPSVQSHQSVSVSLPGPSSSVLQTSGTSNGTSPEPQYRIFKRGDSFSTNQNDQSQSPNLLGPESESHTIDQQSSGGNGVTKADQENLSGVAGAVAIIPQNKTNSRNYQSSKTAVGIVADIAKFHGLAVEYRLINETGPPHCPVFTVVLHLGGETHEGIGPSIKKAQLAAATDALEKTSLPKPPPRNHNRRGFSSWQGHGKGSNWPLLQLSALAEEMNQSLHFVNHPITTVNPFRKVTPTTRVAVHFGDRIFNGEGNSFNSAKNMGVMVALKALSKFKKPEPEVQPRSVESATGSGSPEDDQDEESKSPISIVYEMAFKRNMFISYDVIKEVGPAHMKVFTVQCKVGDELTTESDGFTKQHAKKLASEQMIAKLKEIPVSGDNLYMAMQRGFIKQKFPKRKQAAPVVKDIEKGSVSPISRLIQIAHLRKYKEPEFTVVQSSSGPEETEVVPPETQPGRHNRRNPKLKKPHFVIEVKVGPHVCQGEGTNKKAAKKAAADKALVLLGYASSSSESKKESPKANLTGILNQSSTGSDQPTPSSTKSSPNVMRIISGRQIVPGLLVVRNQSNQVKVASESEQSQNSGAISISDPPATQSPSNPSPTVAPIVHESVNKLSYLAQLLGVPVSYTDFPTKNDYLSVVSLGTTPPQVSHGIGPSMEKARNNAALQLLRELSDKGLENEPKPSSDSQVNTENHPSAAAASFQTD